MKKDPATKPAPKELSAAELETVTGGKAQPGDFHFTHVYDKASPVLAKK